MLAAFGAGALIAALSVELVAPTVFALHGDGHHGDPNRAFYALIVGAMAGGVLYFLLDQLVNAHGGFLRRTATSVTYFQLRRRRRRARIAEELGRFPLLGDLETEHMDSLVNMLRPVTYNNGDVVIRQGETGRELIFILAGAVRFVRDGGRNGAGWRAAKWPDWPASCCRYPRREPVSPPATWRRSRCRVTTSSDSGARRRSSIWPAEI